MTWLQRFRLREYVRASLWILPALLVALAIVLAVVLPEVDRLADGDLSFAFGRAAAIGVLSAIAGGMITFTGFVFSISLVAVQFGSTEFTPRLLRTFMRDLTTKIALGTFVATFIYALVVLAEVTPEDDPEFVPFLSVTFAIVLLLGSVAMFLRLIHVISRGLRAAHVVRSVGQRGRAIIDELYTEPAPESDPSQHPRLAEPLADRYRTVRHLGDPGVLQATDEQGLIDEATRVDALIVVAPAIGDFVPTGAPLFYVYETTESIDERLLSDSIAVGEERTTQQDPAFVIRILVDIAAKALSPGVNDPTTAVQAIDQLDDLLRRLGTRRLRVGELLDTEGQLRVEYQAPTWDDYLELALTEFRVFGEGSPQIHRRLLALLTDIDESIPDYRKPPIRNHLDALARGGQRGFPDADDIERARIPDDQGIGSYRIPGPRRPTNPTLSNPPD